MNMTKGHRHQYLMELPPNYREIAQKIADHRSQATDGRTRAVQLAEAIRYAIVDTWARLQEKGTTDES